MSSIIRLFGTALLLAGIVPAAFGQAQYYPSRPVRIIVAVPAGTAGDVTARVLANELGRKYHQRFLIDNKPGANGAIAVGALTSAARDGYTLLFAASSALTLTPHLDRDMRWNPLRDLEPIVELGVTPIAIGVNRTSPVNSLDDLLQEARGKPDTVKVGILPLSMGDLALRMLESAEYVKFTHVAYAGSSDMIGALLSGEIQVGFLGVGGIANQFAAGGPLKPLAMTTTGRIAVFPDTPAVGETIKGFDAGSWFGVFGPKDVDPKVVAFINTTVNDAIIDPTVKASMDGLGTNVTGGPPAILNG